MEQERSQERHEVYERIPWETLDKPRGDRQWLVYAIGGAVVLGALAYSYMSNRAPAAPVAGPPPSTVVTVPTPTAPPATAPPPVISNPVVVAEADLYAVDPERMVDSAAAHAEWFVAEYFTVDGSEEQRAALAALMPAGMPLPSAPQGTRVFVESTSAVSVSELAPLRYEVGVLVRYLVASDREAYVRRPPILAIVEVAWGDDGPQIALPPRLEPTPTGEPAAISVSDVPAPVAEKLQSDPATVEILGGEALPDGTWRVLVVQTGADGVNRPVTVLVP